MELLLDELSDAALAAANYANLYEWVLYMGRSPAADYRQGPPLTWMLSGVPIAFLNPVYVEPGAGEVERAVRDALAYFRSRGVRVTSWWARPGVDQAALGRQLEAHGLVLQRGPSGMAYSLRALGEADALPAGLTIEPVTSEPALRRWAHVLTLGMGAPSELEPPNYALVHGFRFDFPRRSYLGYLDGEPVASSQLFLGAGVAGIYDVATLPAARNRGIGASMTLAALRDARALGYHVAVLQASSMGFPVYERLGFREVCRMSHWEWHETA